MFKDGDDGDNCLFEIDKWCVERYNNDGVGLDLLIGKYWRNWFISERDINIREVDRKTVRKLIRWFKSDNKRSTIMYQLENTHSEIKYK